MSKHSSSTSKLLIIKVVHTVIWAFFVLTLMYILYSAIIDRITLYTWTAIMLIVLEGVVLLINGWRCPLTTLGEKYTEQTEVGFDIFLPRWVAKNNKLIFTTIYIIGILLVVYRLIT